MIIIATVSDKYFSVNGVNYAKIYQPLKQGVSSIGLYNINDTRQQLISSTSFDEYEIDGVVYGSQALAVAALLPVVYLEDAYFDERVYNYNGDQIINNIENNPDEEDLTATATLISLKDRANTSGKRGYKIIRSGFDWGAIPSGHSNSIWEIRYAFDLAGGNVTLPEGVTLFFNGGIIKNYGVITGNKTTIKAGDVKIFDATGSLFGSWNVPKYKAVWFGAVGDGVTDDASAIQATINSAYNVYKATVELASKKFLISSKIELKSKLHFIIGGQLIRDTTVTPFDMIEGDGVEDVTVEGGIIDGVEVLNVATPSNRFCGIRFWDSSGSNACNNIKIIRSTVINTSHGEIQAEGSRSAIVLEDTENGIIQECIAYNNRGSSVLIQGSRNKDCKVLNCYLYDNESFGSAITGNSHTGLIVSGNHCFNTKYTPISVNGKNAIISNNIVYNAPNGFAGITIGHNSVASNASGTVCDGNIIRDCGTDSSFIAGIVISNSDDVIVSNNVIKNSASRAIRFLGTPVDATGGVKIFGNTITKSEGIGILIEWGEGVDIGENYFLDNVGTAIYIDGTKNDSGSNIDNIFVRNNLFKNNGTGVNGSGVLTAASTPEMNCFVYGNTFISDGVKQQNGIWSSGSNTTIYVKGNDFNSSYTEALAYRITSGGSYVFKGEKNSDVVLVSGGSLLNGWSSVASLGYWKDKNGIVHLQGAANGGSVSTAVFNLPVGFRPAVSQNFRTLANSAGAICAVSSTGDVILYTSNVNHYVNNISFRADTSADAS